MALTEKQQRFVAEYLVDLNATQAAIRTGYSPKTAKQQGSRLLTNADVCAAIQASHGKRLTDTGVTADRVIAELARLGFSDLRAVFGEDGQIKALEDMPEEVSRMISSVEVSRVRTRRGDESETEESIVKIRAWDKVQALGMLAKHLGLLKEKVEHSGPNGAPLTFTLNLNARDRDL